MARGDAPRIQHRMSQSLDVQRAGQAFARPGMDTRNWFCEAVVTAFKLDPEQGAFADVTIFPSLQPETVRVGPFYAGPGFGFYAPLDVDDHVVVAFPDGDPDRGGVIVARMWSAADKPPDLAANNDGDVCLVVKKDVTLRMQVFGSGNVVLGAENGKVLLGDESGTQPVHRKGDHEDVGTLTLTLTGTTVLSGAYVDPDGNSTPVVSGNPIMLKGKANEGSGKVESA